MAPPERLGIPFIVSDPTLRSHSDKHGLRNTMIFVTVGTTHFPFDRLLSAVATLETNEELVVQRGPSQVPVGNACVIDFLSFDELNDHVREAGTVISHAGVGSIMVALSHGKRPIVVPRLERFGEAVRSSGARSCRPHPDCDVHGKCGR